MLFWSKMVSDRGVLLLEKMFWHFNKVRFGQVQTSSAKYCHPLNSKPDHRTSLATDLNFELDLGLVLPGSGSNFGSGPNRGITNLYLCTIKFTVLETLVLSRWEGYFSQIGL
jgi:hypothetical protein